MILCRIRIICWHSFWSLKSSGSSVISSHNFSQYNVSEASFLLINTLLRKSFLELAFFASMKFAPTLEEDLISWLIIDLVRWFTGNRLLKRSVSFANSSVLALKSIGALITLLIDHSLYIELWTLNIACASSAEAIRGFYNSRSSQRW